MIDKEELLDKLEEAAEENRFLASLVENDIASPGQDDEASLLTIRVKERSGNDVLIEFGFDKNRFGRLIYWQTWGVDVYETEPDLTGIWGAPGREHNQWLRDLEEDAEYWVVAQTSVDGEAWEDVGDPLPVSGPESEKDTGNTYRPDLSNDNSLADVLRNGLAYSHDTADRISIAAGAIMQRFDATDYGSHHDQAAAKVKSGFREYTIEQTVKFADDFDAVLGGKFGFGMTGGTGETTSGGSVNPAGFSVTHMWRPSATPGMIALVLYTYQANRKFNNGGTWGDDNPIGLVTLGEWHAVKTVIGLNSDASKADGYMRVSIDGKPAMEVLGVQWQSEGNPGEDMRLEYKAFFGGNTAKHAPKKSEYMWLKGILCSWTNETDISEPKPSIPTAVLPPFDRPEQTPLVFPTAIGQQVREPVSNTIIECVSNNPGYSHDYSISSPENADGTLLMLHNSSTDTSDMKRNQDIIVHADSLELYRDKGYDLGSYRRWSYNDPDTLFCLPNSIKLNGPTNILKAYHPSSDKFETLYDFPNKGFAGWTISIGGGDGTQDWNDRFMPITATKNGQIILIVFDLVLRKIHSQLDWSSIGRREAVNVPDSVRGTVIPADSDDGSFTMSRDGKYCVLWRGGDWSNKWHSMYEVFHNDWTNRREIGGFDEQGVWTTMHVSHMTTGVDMQGNQVMCSENQPGEHHFIPLDKQEIEFIRYPAKGWGHTSTSKGLPGYVSSYGYDIALNDPWFDGTIAMVLSPMEKTSSEPVFSLNDHGLPMYAGRPVSDMRQFGYHRSSGIEYFSTPRAALTTVGDKLYFVSNNSGQPRGYRIFAE